MDAFGDGKVLLCLLLVCAAATLASTSGLSKAGYDYKAASGGLNTILKAVLVHESTGHGLHDGSVSGQNDGQRVTVMRERPQPTNTNAGYSYSGPQQMGGLREMKGIRVFHKSLGATGNIRPPGFNTAPQVQMVKVIRDYVPQQRQPSFNAIKRDFSVAGAGPSQSLRYIHETALARPSFFLPTVVPPEAAKSGYNYPNAQQSPSNGYQYSQPSNQGLPRGPNQASNGPSGYRYQSPGAPLEASNGPSGYQYQSPGAPLEASNGPSGYQYQSPGAPLGASNSQPPSGYPQPAYRQESPRSQGQGYSYQTPAPTPAGDAEQIAISHYFSSAVQPANQGYRYDKPQEPSVAPQYVEPDGYQYSNPPPVSQPAQGLAPAEPANAGYHYDRPEISFDYDKPAVTKSNFKGQSYLPLPAVGSEKSYDRPQPAQTYERPEPSERPRTVFRGPSYLPLPPASGGW